MAHQMLIGIGGKSLTGNEAAMLARPDVAGIILFKRNYADAQQLQLLCHEIRAAVARPVVICVDQEGGRVQRFCGDGLTKLPSLGLVGRLWDSDTNAAFDAAREHAWLMAMEIRALGVDFSFAPVVDLDNGSSVIGDRAFHSNPGVVAALGLAYMQGLRQAGAPGVAKHFPGHGSVVPDTHFAVARDERPYSAIQASDLRPFRALLDNQVEGIMMGHVIYPCRSSSPAGFSRAWCRQCLRQELDYAGVIFSDDLGMAGAGSEDDAVSRKQRAQRAGCEISLVCDPAAVEDVLGRTPVAPETDSGELENKLSGFRAHNPLGLDELHASARWQAAHGMLESLRQEGTTS